MPHMSRSPSTKRRPAAGRRRRRRDTPAQAFFRFAVPFVLTLAVALGAGFGAVSLWRQADGLLHPAPAATATSMPQPTLPPTPAPTPVSVDLSGINSPYALLMERGGTALGSLQPDAPCYPASMTKLMTVLLAVENLPDLDAPVTLDGRLFADLWAQNASMAGFAPGETVTVRDILYGAMLPSGAECSVTIAGLVDGSVDAFVQHMNRRAAELGMTATHFVNPTGLHDPEHVSTVRDIALLLDRALENRAFRTVFTAAEYTTTPTEAHPEGIRLQSTMFAMLGGRVIPGVTPLGGKTGYTDEAGQCLASLASCGGKEYILVTAGAPGNNHEEFLQVDDAITVYTRLSCALGQQDSPPQPTPAPAEPSSPEL